jgi:hypothetical protein
LLASTTPHSSRVLAWAIAGIALALVPIFVSTIPPLADYPNHLARAYILSHLESSPELAEYYRDVTSAQPNLAFDAVVTLLSRVMPLETAGRVFVGLTIIAMVGGAFALHRACHGHASVWPLLSLFFVYNRLFLWGFVAYLFTLGCAMGAFAAWIALHRRPVIRLLTATILATLLYLGHLYAFGVYALCIAGYELALLWHRRYELRPAILSAASAAAQFVPAVYLFVLVSPTSGAAAETYWGPLWRKLTAPANLTYNYHPGFDLACLGLLAAIVLWGLLRAHVTVNRFMIGPLALLSIAFLIMPDQLFSSFGADRRLPIAIVLVAIAALEWRASNQWVVVGLAALFVVRVALISEVWAHSATVYREYLAAIERVPYGAKLLVVVAHPSEIALPPIPAFEIANLAIIYRRAFVPSLFHFPREAATTVAFSPDMQKLAQETPPHIIRPDMLKLLKDREYANRKGPFRADLLSQYDCVLIARLSGLPLAPPSGEKLYEGHDFMLVKTRG